MKCCTVLYMTGGHIGGMENPICRAVPCMLALWIFGPAQYPHYWPSWKRCPPRGGVAAMMKLEE